MIEVKDLTYRYAGSRRKVFDGFSMAFAENKIYGLLGKNGTGKSTLLYLISGLLRPEGGSIRFDGMETSRRLPDFLKEVFLVPEEYDLPNLSLKEHVRMMAAFYPRFSEEVLRQCLRDFEMEEEPDLKALSMGQKKKVYMSMALAAGTRLLLMDEPTNGLDIPSKSLFRKVVANNMADDRTLIISTHQVHDVESLLDHILILDEQRLLLDSSVADLTARYWFGYLSPSETDSRVLYAEPTLQGNASMRLRETSEVETPLNLELLFNAVTKGIGNENNTKKGGE